jgi:hypothetical protein
MFVQVFLTFIKLEVTPFFLFGMYSQKINATDTLSAMQVLVNDEPLVKHNPPFREKELVMTNAENYIRMVRNNGRDIVETRVEQKYPTIKRSYWYSSIAVRIFNTPEAIERFKPWFRAKCLKIAGMSDGTVRIVEATYVLNRKTMQLTLIKNETLEIF